MVTLLQRSLRHVQLVNDSRADSKTGLLNAATWEREATVEVTRAVRTGTPLAIAMLDIDRFKVINDTYGHLAGDQVLKELARSLDSVLRDYDRAGRFGGEEFSLLLPQTRAVDAFRIAERVRANIAGLSIIVPGATGGERAHVTVSIGVAALDSGSKREYSELMATADAALYRAKSGGRDQVQMISTTRGLSAISGAGDAARNNDGSARAAIRTRRACSAARRTPYRAPRLARYDVATEFLGPVAGMHGASLLCVTIQSCGCLRSGPVGRTHDDASPLVSGHGQVLSQAGELSR